MMTGTQYLLCKLAEEAGELAQIAMKAQQFGIDGTYKEDSNAERLISEFIDIMGVMSFLMGRGDIRSISEEEMGQGIADKIEKINKYSYYSVECGQLDATFN